MAEIIVQRIGNWKDVWQIDLEDLEDYDESYKVVCNENISHRTLLDDTCFLACVLMREDGKSNISVLATLNDKMKKPYCMQCEQQGCKCLKRYEKLLKDMANDHSSDSEEVEVEFYWQRRKNEPEELPSHYDNYSNFKRYGYNLTIKAEMIQSWPFQLTQF